MSKKWKLARTESAVAALVAAALMESLGSGAALAQVNAPVSQAGSSASGQVEEVVVTAQRRSETAQSIPISITAITAKQLENTGIQTTQDLVVATPGLTMTQTLNGVTPYIRGVGTQAATTEGAVAVYVDNVYYASTQGAIFALNNVDRVEVLKGPQGTLFGRNATGGLINVITRDPKSYAGDKRQHRLRQLQHPVGQSVCDGRPDQEHCDGFRLLGQRSAGRLGEKPLPRQ